MLPRTSTIQRLAQRTKSILTWRQFFLCFVAVSSITLLNSCVHYKNSSRVVPVAESKVALTTNVADVQVNFSTRIQAVSDQTRCVHEAKNQAYYRAILSNNIDVLVDPIYEVKSKGKKSTASVTGYGGKYINVRTAKEEEQLVFEQKLKNTQTAFDQTMVVMDRKIQELDKFSKVPAVASEDLKTYLIIGGGENKGGGEKVLNTDISVVDKYNKLSGGGAAAAPAEPVVDKPAASPMAQGKEKGKMSHMKIKKHKKKECKSH